MIFRNRIYEKGRFRQPGAGGMVCKPNGEIGKRVTKKENKVLQISIVAKLLNQVYE